MMTNLQTHESCPKKINTIFHLKPGSCPVKVKLSLSGKFFKNTFRHHRSVIVTTVHGILEFWQVRFHPSAAKCCGQEFIPCNSFHPDTFPTLCAQTGPVDIFRFLKHVFCHLSLITCLCFQDEVLTFTFKYDIK